MVVGDAEGNAFAGLAKNRRPTQAGLMVPEDANSGLFAGNDRQSAGKW
jgi:hypothetical protein